MMQGRRANILKKIMARVTVDPKTSCWAWTGPTSGSAGRGAGYPRMSLDGGTVAVHIAMYVLHNGPVPPRKQIDHLCRNRLCVAPHHLEMVTHKENQKRRDKARETITCEPLAKDENLESVLHWLEVGIRDVATRNVGRNNTIAAAALAAAMSVGGCSLPRQPAFGQSAKELHSLVDKTADRHGVPRKIAHSVVRVESAYRCKARNAKSGATGIMQVKPATARSVGVTGNLTDCKTGLEAGMRYLRLALNKGGVGCAGVSLYERGIFARPTCTGYGRKVMGMM